MYPLYLVIGLVNVLAKSNNYGININDTRMDIRVRRDIQEMPIIEDNYKVNKPDNLREKRELQYIQNDQINNVNYSKGHNRTTHKRRSHNHGMYIPRTRARQHKTYAYDPDLTRIKPDNRIQETGYNQARLQKRQSLPTPQPYSKPEQTTSKPLFKKIWSFLSGNKTTTPKYGIPTPGVGNSNGVSAKLKKKKRKIIPACVLCDTGCPVGYERKESYCISEDPDYV